MKTSEQSDTVYLLQKNTFLLGQNMIGVVGNNTEFMCLTQTSALVGYLDCYDVTCYEYDWYNNIFWVGNSLGELFGYTLTFANANDLNKGKNDKSKGSFEGTSCFKDAKEIPLTQISDSTDSKIIQNLFYAFTSNKGCTKMKSFYLYFFQNLPNGTMKTDSAMFECKTSLTSISQEFCFATETGKLDLIKSSRLSNIVLAVNSSSTITIWDVYDKCILVRLHPPHFTQAILLQNFSQKKRVDISKLLNKEFVAIQSPVAIDVSTDNEDFAVISQDYLSVYSCSGLLIASERSTSKQGLFTCVCIVRVVHNYQKLFTVEDHMVLVGDSSGTLNIYQLKEKQNVDGAPRSFTFSTPKMARHESQEANSPSERKKTVLEFFSPVLESGNRDTAEEDKAARKDQKYSYGYFINRNRYYKQSIPQFSLELVQMKHIARGLAIRDIKVTRAQTHIYVLLSDGTSSVL